MVHTLGWTWTTAEQELDLHRLAALTRHWRKQPPVHVLVAAYLDYKPPEPTRYLRADDEAPQELAHMLAAMPVRTGPALNDDAWRDAVAQLPAGGKTK